MRKSTKRRKSCKHGRKKSGVCKKKPGPKKSRRKSPKRRKSCKVEENSMSRYYRTSPRSVVSTNSMSTNRTSPRSVVSTNSTTPIPVVSTDSMSRYYRTMPIPVLSNTSTTPRPLVPANSMSIVKKAPEYKSEYFKKLEKTYNTNLYTFDRGIYTNNKVINELIKRKKAVKPALVKYVDGPTILEHLINPVNGKDAYIFGEYHTPRDCPGVNVAYTDASDFILSQMNNSNSFVDFFLEVNPLLEDTLYDDPTNTLGIIRYNFKDCFGLDYDIFNPAERELDDIQSLQKQKRLICKAEKVPIGRVHSIDIRDQFLSDFEKTKGRSNNVSILDISNGNIFRTIEVVDYTTDEGLFSDRAERVNRFENFYNFILLNSDFLTGKNIEYLAEKLWVAMLLMPGFWKLTDSSKFDQRILAKLKEFSIKKISDMLIGQLEYYRKIYPDGSDIMRGLDPVEMFFFNINFDSEVEPDYVSDYYSIKSILREIHDYTLLITVDNYTIYRMFKKYDVDSETEQPEEVYSMIYYGGSAHAENIIEFLRNYMGFDSKNRVSDGIGAEGKCLDISMIKQPFFTEYYGL